MTIENLTTYSDAGLTTEETTFAEAATMYMDGDMVGSAATTTTTVKIEIFNSADALQDTPLDTTHNFTNNTAQNIKTDINGNTVVSQDLTGYTPGQHYLKLTRSGTGVETTILKVQFKIVAAGVATPVISSPAFDDSTITQDTALVATATSTNTDEAYIVFYSTGTTTIVHEQEMTVTGNALSVTIPAGSLPVGSYTTGDIKIVSINTSVNTNDTDETLTLTVSASGKSITYNVAENLKTVLAADARITDYVASEDIVILSSEKDVLHLHSKWPAVAIIPGSYDASKAGGTINKQLYSIDCWVLVCDLAHGKTIQDLTDVERAHTLIKSVADIIEEQNADASKRLAQLVDFCHAVNCNPTIYEGKLHGDIYAAIIKMEAELLAT